MGPMILHICMTLHHTMMITEAVACGVSLTSISVTVGGVLQLASRLPVRSPGSESAIVGLLP